MGELFVNAELTAHGNPTGGEDQWLRLHHGDEGLDDTVPIGLSLWNKLRSHTRANDRTNFDTDIQTLTVDGGWSQDKLDACWTAAVRNWADNSSVD